MKILIIGGGGREHAIGWKFKQDALVGNYEVDLFFAPGNAGSAQIGTNVSIANVEELRDFAFLNQIELTFVGPEAELSEGIVDLFQAKELKIFGPNQKAAQLESSKAFAKDFMLKHGVKTADYKCFQGKELAKEYAQFQDFPVVVKASGLAAGKGVIICEDLAEAENAVKTIMEDKAFGDAGDEVVIEEFLNGFEVSILSVFNGNEIVPFISAKDHKRIGNGDSGPNTGGMGVIAPNPLFTEAHFEAFKKDILEPTLKGLIEDELIFAGVIFFGLMVNSKGVFLLEYNLRMGDPETQTVLPLMQSDFLNIIQKAINGESFEVDWKNEKACCVVMVSGGYPGNIETGFEIRGLENVECPYFIAGGKLNIEGKPVTSGGRVINVVGVGDSLDAAREIAYENVEKIHYDYEFFRDDIGVIK